MKKAIQILTVIIITSWIAPSIFSQPCLTGWRYRRTIEMNNGGSSLTNHQVSVVVNTQVLVALGKARADGGDIRFTDASGNSLSFWYDPLQYNSSSTTFWIKTNATAGSSFIYMFYGNATSPSVASGEGTFELFDSFNSGSISPLVWDKCGNNINVSVVGGTATFQSNTTTFPRDYLITSKQSFSTQIITECKVNSAATGRSVIGVIDNANDGYANTFENGVVKMMKISAGGDCKLIEQLTLPNPTSVASINGINGFTWISSNSQNITWPSGSSNYSDTDKSTSFGNPKKVIIGNAINTTLTSGTFTLDYVRVRKYAATVPVLTLGVENEAPVNPIATNTGPYCGGDAIVLSTNTYAGALYSWTGPGGFTSTSQNPPPFTSSPALSGTYQVNITMPGGCNAVNISTNVSVSTASVSGTISGAATLCEGYNSGTLTLSGENGDILRWEMSNSAIGPWVTLSNNTNTLNYQNLSDTTYYRSVVQSGSCPSATSPTLQVNIDKATVGGFTLGTDNVCEGLNGGDVNLVYQNGNILKWESSTDGVIWSDITNSTTQQSYSNLTTTTMYRALVQSGVCPAQYSSQTTISVNPNPVSSFTATTVCQGNNTQFTSTSSISNGSIVNYNWNFGNGSGSIAQNTFNQYANSGTYTVALTTISDKGCSNSTTMPVTVNANPSVNFNASNVCLGQPMNFQSVVSVVGSTISSLLWNFDDGNTATQNNVNYTYTNPGSYDVTLTATSAQGCIDSITKTVQVSQPVAVDFIADSVCLGEPIQFSNTSLSGSTTVQYIWNFGDGNTSTLLNPSHTYAARGVYTVILQASLSGGGTSCQSSKSLNVEVYERPTANFTFNNECLSDTVSFVNQSIFTGGLSNLTYNWNFDDGNLSNNQDEMHKYNIPGLYQVSLEVESIFGCTSEIDKQVEIYEMPNANFTVNNVCLNQPSEFVNTSTIALGTMTYNWDFDNGNTSIMEAPFTTYSGDGDYQVQLIATSNNGCLDTIVKLHTIFPKPLARFFYDEVCDGNPTLFYDSSLINSGTINSFSWNFGDGSSANGTTPSHQYLNVGSYSVSLSVVSDKLCTDDTTMSVIVNPNPVANFSIQDACIGAAVSFTNNSFISSGTMSMLWDFGDGGASNQASPSYTYGNVGLYPVKLIVTSGKGCHNSVVKTAEVFAPPFFTLGLDDTISLGDEVELEGFYPGALAYSWSPSEGLDNSSLSNPSASPSESTTYTLTVTDGNGCKGQDSIYIHIIEDFNLTVSNLITPDGNGVNDFWVVGNIENYGEATIFIYDRWGKEILKTNNYQNDWNGVSGTDQLPDGTYYYIITLPGQEKVYKGGITVLRNK